MKIIVGNTSLRQCIPNTLATVAGEPTWYEKLYPFLEAAEFWVESNFLGESLMDALTQEEDSSPLRMLAAKIISTHATMNAVPSLDLVLTPNGFGIVNTGNVVPASKDRVERLIAGLEKERDGYIEQLLLKLPAKAGWLQTRQGEYFAATLFPFLNICSRLAIREHLWEEYQKLRTRLIKIEDVLAETYFSQEQMTVFRQKVITMASVHPVMQSVIRTLRSLEMMLVTDMQVHPQSFYDIVNTIRENDTIFPEWHESKTSELYYPTVFMNKKESGGYWF